MAGALLGRTKDLTADMDVEMEPAISAPVTTAHTTTRTIEIASHEAALIAGTNGCQPTLEPLSAEPRTINAQVHTSPCTLAGASQPEDVAAPPAPQCDAARRGIVDIASREAGTKLPTNTGASVLHSLSRCQV